MENPQHFIDHEGFADVIECAVVHGMNGGLHRSVCRHDDDLCIRVDAFHAFQQVETGIIAEVDIADENVEAFLLHGTPGLFRRHGHAKRIGFHLENGSHQLADRAIVVDDQNLGFWAHVLSSVAKPS